MSINRIQKLLISEYCDFEDMVLVESPFAETTREGRGVRQVQLGLTPSKLVMATDILPFADISLTSYLPGIDPEIETFELIAVYPIDCVNLSVFHRRKRQSLKAHFCNNKVLYFELGGFEKRNMFWNLWCEKVKFLNPYDPNSCHSETSVATSTTNSTLYLVSSKRVLSQSGSSQVWCQYAAGDFARSDPPKWTDKYLYLGKNLEESSLAYTPCQMTHNLADFVNKKFDFKGSDHSKLDKKYNQNTTMASVARNNYDRNARIARFSSDVKDNCSTKLLLSKGKINFPPRVEQVYHMHTVLPGPIDYEELAENAVRLWEFYRVTASAVSIRGKHKRRYAFAPQPHFFHGLGPWNVNPGERYSLQIKRAVSVVSIKRQPLEPELRLSVSRRQLIASISCDNLHSHEKLINVHNTIRMPPKRPLLLFWTPEYWYRPRSARDAYQELQSHLKKIRQYHQIRDTFRSKIRRRGHTGKASGGFGDTTSDSNLESKPSLKIYDKRNKLFKNKLKPLSRRLKEFTEKEMLRSKSRETSLQYLKRILKMDIALTAWDFDSDTLAFQLTLIDKELFLKITPAELGVLVWQKSSKNAPNIGALVAFSHRISCLVVTEVLKDDSEKIRARLVARFINTAEKCNRISNFQSCRSVLCGLQSPPVYRLYSMWSYLRKRHSSKYEIFEKLCKLYRDPRLSTYQKTFATASKNPPYLPFIGDLIGKLLDQIPEYTAYPSNSLGIKVSVKSNHPTTSKPEKAEEFPKLLKKILSSFRGWQTEQRSKAANQTALKEKKMVKLRGLADYYKPLSCHEDNREPCLQECIKLLHSYQRGAASYVYARNELCREYLLKARYREDKENFLYSFNIESALKIDEK